MAIQGDRFDGHDFIPDAVKKGARAILCRQGTAQKTGISSTDSCILLEVDDVLSAYRMMAHHHRMRFQIPVIVVAGSVGKTTTKELLASALSVKFPKILKTTASQNGFLGVAMTLLELTPDHHAAVIEVGIDEPHAMRSHLDIIQPTASLLTAIGPEHLEKLIDLETVAFEESQALLWVDQNRKSKGQIALNLDDPYIAPIGKEIRSAKQMTFSVDGQAMVMAEKVVETSNAQGTFSTLSVVTPTGKATLKLSITGKHHMRNALAALSAALLAGASLDEAAQGIQKFSAAYGRSEMKWHEGVAYFCDYYNANPTSVTAALENVRSFCEQTSAPQAVLVLADMLELGQLEEKWHRDLAPVIESLATQKTAIRVLLIGPKMLWLQDELKKRAPSVHAQHFQAKEELTRSLKTLLKPGSMVLIKGSRGMKMEEVFQWATQKS